MVIYFSLENDHFFMNDLLVKGVCPYHGNNIFLKESMLTVAKAFRRHKEYEGLNLSMIDPPVSYEFMRDIAKARAKVLNESNKTIIYPDPE